MPKRTDIKSILIIGAGPIIIGQACEFDYSGAQACKALREEGYKVILVNSNPATIMTDPEMADVTFIEPITWKVVERIIDRERPDAILPTMGGQTALNCALDLYRNGVLEKYNVELIGASPEAIDKAEDRSKFKEAMTKIGLSSARSGIAHSLDEAWDVQKKIGFPVIIRPSFTLGGTGGGIAYNEEEFDAICRRGLEASPTSELLIEESLIGWKEYEMEVVRDKADNCIIVCSIENLDPMGVHTGDSITVAPAQTLTDKEYQLMRNASISILREIGVDTGGSNVQFAINPKNGRMIVIEMNPRVSRSSALASKATGFPIAKVASKLAVGFTLDELKNDITGGATPASFEPTIDYVVTKVPRFTFEKFPSADPHLTTQMKSVGEVMAIGRTFQESFQKALRGLEVGVEGMNEKTTDREVIKEELGEPGPERIWYVGDAFAQGFTLEEVHNLTHIDPWFLAQIKEIVDIELWLDHQKLDDLDKDTLFRLKQKGFSDKRLAWLLKTTDRVIREKRHAWGIRPVYKRVDTCAAEFATNTAYMYSTYDEECEAEPTNRKKIMVLGGGPNRIGQGIEFDYCSVHATWAFARAGYETIIINNNPETVSTDFDIADKLYFEPLTPEDVENIVNIEKPDGAVVQFGGQTAIKLTESLMKMGVPILGTKAEDVDAAEDRELFDEILQQTEIPRAAGGTVYTAEEAKAVANRLGYPVLVRPSYVLGGQGMQIATNDQEIEEFMEIINRIAQDHPILVDKYLQGKEIEVDAVCDGTDILIPGIMEHIERTGIHSGDSISVYPAPTIDKVVKEKIAEYTRRLAKALHVKGLINIQFIAIGEEVYVIEVNPRSSRTVPYISKVTGIPIVDLATEVIIGKTIRELGYEPGLQPEAAYFAIKMPVFSFEKIRGAEISLGPEMKSTGECLGIAKTFNEALYKAFLGAGVQLPKYKQMIITVKDADKGEAIEIGRRFEKLGYTIYATRSTAAALQDAGVKARKVNKISQESPTVMDLILGHKIDLVIDTPTQGRDKSRDGFLIRRTSIETGVYCITAMDTARALVTSMENAAGQLSLVDIASL